MMIRLSMLYLFLCGALLPVFLQAQEYGKASYYANEFDGGRTFFGETYDKDKFTAAHKVHPQGTRLKVTRQDNGRSVIVRVNDRGPYVSGRIIELSYAAARELGMIDEGLVDVKVEVLSKGTSTPPAQEQEPAERSTQRTRGTNTGSNPPAASNTETSSTANESVSLPTGSRQRPTQQPASSPATNQSPAQNSQTQPDEPAVENRPENERIVRGYQEVGLFEVKMLNVRRAGFGVQVASFSSYENTLKRLTELQGMWFDNIIVSVEKAGGNKLYKLILGPFETREKANSYLGSLRKNKKGVDGFVVDLSAINYDD